MTYEATTAAVDHLNKQSGIEFETKLNLKRLQTSYLLKPNWKAT